MRVHLNDELVASLQNAAQELEDYEAEDCDTEMQTTLDDIRSACIQLTQDIEAIFEELEQAEDE